MYVSFIAHAYSLATIPDEIIFSFPKNPTEQHGISTIKIYRIIYPFLYIHMKNFTMQQQIFYNLLLWFFYLQSEKNPKGRSSMNFRCSYESVSLLAKSRSIRTKPANQMYIQHISVIVNHFQVDSIFFFAIYLCGIATSPEMCFYWRLRVNFNTLPQWGKDWKPAILKHGNFWVECLKTLNEQKSFNAS